MISDDYLLAARQISMFWTNRLTDVSFFQLQVGEYKEAEQQARKAHIGIWKYGDVSEDNAVEFG